MVDTDVLQAAKEAVKRPDSFAYYGDLDMFDTWGLTGPGMHRDSDILSISNYTVISEDLMSRFPEDFEVVSSSHFLVGWSDQLACRVFNENGEVTEAFCALLEWEKALADYPVADEMDFSQREWEDFVETIKNCYYTSEFEWEDNEYETLDSIPDDWAAEVASYIFDNFSVTYSDELNEDMVNEAVVCLCFAKKVEE